MEENEKNRNKKWVEQYLFSQKEMDDMVQWHPVSNISVDEIYKGLPEVKEFHNNYVNLWLKNKER